MTSAPRTAVADAVAVSTLWGGVRIVVIDTETTRSPDNGPIRVVSIAAVTCRAGSVRGKWQSLVNPGVPIDQGSQHIHGITDEHLEGEPIFAAVANLLLPLLEEADGERLVVAGHNIGYDISALRHELSLIGKDLPELSVLDTMGKLPGLVGVKLASRSQADLIAALGISNSQPHEAMADATACAEALVALLNLAAAQGHTDFDELLETVNAGATTKNVRSGGIKIEDREIKAKVLPPQHLEGHTSVLSNKAKHKMLETWRAQVAECAELRCRHLDERVSEAGVAPQKRVVQLEDVMAETAAAGDIAGTATALGAFLSLFDSLPKRSARDTDRYTILAWVQKWSPVLSALGRCEEADQCPACRDGKTCPLDAWPEAVARAAVPDPSKSAVGFLNTVGRNRGRGSYVKWADDGVDQRVCDEGLLRVIDHGRSIDRDTDADRVVILAWDLGCRHPDVADAYAGLLAGPGRPADLQAALDVCDQAFEQRRGSTHTGWSRLWSRRNQIAGRAERLAIRHSGVYDEDGNPVAQRRHTPANPRKTRPARFLRQDV